MATSKSKTLLKNKVKREKDTSALPYIAEYPAVPIELNDKLRDACASWYARAYVNEEAVRRLLREMWMSGEARPSFGSFTRANSGWMDRGSYPNGQWGK